MRLLVYAAAVLALAICFVTPVSAATIVGGSSLLTQADAGQLQVWLNEGPISITNIFSHQDGDGKTALDFHAAADNKGRTFSLIEVLGGTYFEYGSIGGGYVIIPTQIVGGYNPRSWNSEGVYNTTVPDAERTAFLFNLTTDFKQNQNLSSQPNGFFGRYQTLNISTYGPTFGNGHDLHVGDDLNRGYAYNYSYGGFSGAQNIIDSPSTASNFWNQNLQIGRIEVFTIAPAAIATVPEPASLAIWGLGAVAMAWGVRRQRTQAAST